MLAREGAIAEVIGRQLARTDGAVVPPEVVEKVIIDAEKEIAATLSGEQRAAAVSICVSGRGADLVEGVAGAGKTTMLRVVADAFERSGCQVFGTATSGQAARNLAQEAGISRSRTLASLIWRLDHGRLVLNERTVVVLDETGMTDDVDLARLAAYVELAGAKLVLTGDHHQLGPIGPGGALGALVARHHRSCTTSGRTGASSTNKSNGRSMSCVTATWARLSRGTHALPVRDDALQAAVDAWPPISQPGTRQGCTPGGGPTWPI